MAFSVACSSGGNNNPGSGGSGSGGSAGGAGSGAIVAGAGGAGMLPAANATCPSLTLARASNGDCVPRITEYDVAEKPTSIVLGSDSRVWVDDEARDELIQLDDFGQVIGRVLCEAGSSPRALLGGARDVVIAYTSAGGQSLVEVDRSGNRVTTGLGFEASGIALAPSGDLFLSEPGKAVYQLPPDRAAPTRFDASPTDAIAVSGDGAVWFSEGAGLGRLIPGRGVDHFFLGVTVYATALCFGPDSGLWFSDDAAHQLVGVRADGAPFRTLNLPTGTSPGRIIVGPDGALWFTETGVSMLGRATLGGEITHYPLPTPNGLPLGLVAGSDGNIWFTAPESRKVGRLILDPAP